MSWPLSARVGNGAGPFLVQRRAERLEVVGEALPQRAGVDAAAGLAEPVQVVGDPALDLLTEVGVAEPTRRVRGDGHREQVDRVALGAPELLVEVRERAGSQFVEVAHFAVQAASVDDFKAQAQRTMVEPTRTEPGCLRYELWQDLAEPTRFAMVEEWESEEALATHLALPSLQAAVAAIAPMASEPVSMQRFRPQR